MMLPLWLLLFATAVFAYFPDLSQYPNTTVLLSLAFQGVTEIPDFAFSRFTQLEIL
jgi:hypothetical protein